MINILPSTKIYVYCPAGAVTGGAELLHQLVDKLNRNQRNAFIVYYGDKEHNVPSDYSSYMIEIDDEIEDVSDNIVIIYEGCYDFINKNVNIQKVLWWLSVDNFYICSAKYLNSFDSFRWNVMFGLKFFPFRFANLFIGNNYFKNTISLNKIRKMNVIHAYQSEYAHNFLIQHQFSDLFPLKDYVNTDHFTQIDTSNREDIVLYNPKKGLNFTKKLIALSPNIRWVPIQNMTRNELVALMRKSKVYVDFGYHPGKDRLPREAAMNGCCVITGLDGSAAFFEDVPIETIYKFDKKRVLKNKIVNQIEYLISNYSSSINDFEFYRRTILNEKNDFDRQVKILFDIVD
jgi:hypothetical protein